MNWLLTVLGSLFALLGAFWILQGTNIILRAFMAGQLQYALFGLVAGLGGIGMIVFAYRRERGSPYPGSPKR